jgi:hypothetical protein
MSVPIHVDAYSGWRANERPRGFQLDDVHYRIYAIEDQWYDPEAAQYFKVRADGKTYLLRYSQHEDEWTLQSGFDGDELLNRPNIQLIPVGGPTIIQAEQLIESCERCNPEGAKTPFDNVLNRVTGANPNTTDYILERPAKCPYCCCDLFEKTRIEPK